MALYAQFMLDLSIELARHDPVYEDFAIKFYDHFVWIASAMERVGTGQCGMWNEEDGFYYDVLRLPDNTGVPLKVRSMVGLLPLCAVTVYPHDVVELLPNFVQHVFEFNQKHADLIRALNPPHTTGVDGRFILSVMDEAKLRLVLSRMLDPAEFLSDYGIRALSRYHLDRPYEFRVSTSTYTVAYRPAESDSGLFGGNSNWRGPIWFPVNSLILRALLQLYTFYGDDFQVECPTGSGKLMNLAEVARDLSSRLVNIFVPDAKGWRPVNGGVRKFQEDPHWRDLVQFYEYFHGDNGAGIGANHQTGWTALVSGLICVFGKLSTHDFLTLGSAAIQDAAATPASR
jgi:hypothetical protein